MFVVGWASRPSPIDGRDAHPTRRKKGNYLTASLTVQIQNYRVSVYY